MQTVNFTNIRMLTLSGYNGKCMYLHLVRSLKIKQKLFLSLKIPICRPVGNYKNDRGAAVRSAGEQIQVNSGRSGTQS